MKRITLRTRVQCYSDNGSFYYTDPIINEPVGPFSTVGGRNSDIAKHYIEPAYCEHVWEEQSRVRCRADPGMVSGTQRCSICNTVTHYTKDENE